MSPWQNMNNFLSVVLEKFPVKVQQYLLTYSSNNKDVSKSKRKEGSSHRSKQVYK